MSATAASLRALEAVSRAALVPATGRKRRGLLKGSRNDWRFCSCLLGAVTNSPIRTSCVGLRSQRARRTGEITRSTSGTVRSMPRIKGLVKSLAGQRSDRRSEFSSKPAQEFGSNCADRLEGKGFVSVVVVHAGKHGAKGVRGDGADVPIAERRGNRRRGHTGTDQTQEGRAWKRREGHRGGRH
jgi:hypothetical protein